MLRAEGGVIDPLAPYLHLFSIQSALCSDNSPQTRTAWLADSTRSLLHPTSLREIIDVVHFEWQGQTGDVEYCS